MNLIPESEFRKHIHLNLAPMVDFLFLVLAVFATMAVSRAALFDKQVDLVQLTSKPETAIQRPVPYLVNLSVTEDGKYKWMTEVNDYIIDTVQEIQKEIIKQQQLGLLPREKDRMRVLLHIDKQAKWEPIAQVIFAVKEVGLQINPVYEPEGYKMRGEANITSK
jgi:biopolymer transport protein ExbD